MSDQSQSILLTDDSLELGGFSVSELLGTDGNARSARLAAGVFGALPAAK
jgi:hypothetical protein